MEKHDFGKLIKLILTASLQRLVLSRFRCRDEKTVCHSNLPYISKIFDSDFYDGN